MSLEPEAPRRVLERRLDPREAVRTESLGGPLLGEAPTAGGPQASAIGHIQAMDPRVRLQQAAEALHGREDEAASRGPVAPPEGTRGQRPGAPKRA